MDVDRPNTLESERTPRVNSARMPDYLGRVVRLVCKVSRVRPSHLSVHEIAKN